MSGSVPTSGGKSGSSSGLRLTPKAIMAIAISVAALIFVFSNTEEIELSFLWLGITGPGWILLLVLFAAGLLTGFFLGRNRYRGR